MKNNSELIIERIEICLRDKMNHDKLVLKGCAETDQAILDSKMDICIGADVAVYRGLNTYFTYNLISDTIEVFDLPPYCPDIYQSHTYSFTFEMDLMEYPSHEKKKVIMENADVVIRELDSNHIKLMLLGFINSVSCVK